MFDGISEENKVKGLQLLLGENFDKTMDEIFKGFLLKTFLFLRENVIVYRSI